MENKEFIYPLPKERLEQLADAIFSPVKQGFCITGFFISGTGKRTLIKFLLKEKIILRNIFKHDFEKTLFVYVDPDEVLNNSNEAFLQLILNRLVRETNKSGEPSSNDPIFKIKDNLIFLVNQGWHIVFLINDFEYTLELSPSIYRNLESILSINKQKISFVFLTTTNLLDSGLMERFHNFKYAINRKTYYYPLLDDKLIDNYLDRLCQQRQLSISEKMTNLLKELCCGHCQLLKYSLTILQEAGSVYLKSPEKARSYLLNYPQLHSVCQDIWDYFQPVEKEILLNVVKLGTFPLAHNVNTDFLMKTGVVKTTDGKHFALCGELFTNFLQQMLPKEKLTYDNKTEQLFYGSKPCNDHFTFQEAKLLTYFVENVNKVISRDEVGQVLWGKKYHELYSDWSIDKIISTMRKKLDEIGIASKKLITLKKRGFTFSN